MIAKKYIGISGKLAFNVNLQYNDFNDTNFYDNFDMLPGGNEVYYRYKRSSAMKTKYISVICALLLIVASLAACKNQPPAKNNAGDKMILSSAKNLGSGSKTFVFEVIDAEGEKTVYNISTDKTIVGDALCELGLISGDDGPYGLYVKTVNSLTYDYDKDGKYWAFYIDGEYAASGVDKTGIVNGEVYSFKVE